MADFLNRLAARALGAIPLAEPAIPARFSSAAQTNAFLATDTAFEPTRPYPETFSESSESRSQPLHPRQSNPTLETRFVHPSRLFQDEAPNPTRPPRTHAFPDQPPPPYAESETVRPSSMRDEFGKRHPVAAENPTPDAIEKPVANVPFVEPRPAPRLTPLAEPMRSPVSQRAERFQNFRPVPPTVSVSIGRIEVRAEMTSPTAPVQRPRPSALSLDQFLKQADRSAR